MDQLDSITIIKEGLEQEIYPLLEMESNHQNYLIYLDNINDLKIEDLYIGEVRDNCLMPVIEDLIPSFEETLRRVLLNIQTKGSYI